MNTAAVVVKLTLVLGIVLGLVFYMFTSGEKTVVPTTDQATLEKGSTIVFSGYKVGESTVATEQTVKLADIAKLEPDARRDGKVTGTVFLKDGTKIYTPVNGALFPIKEAWETWQEKGGK